MYLTVFGRERDFVACISKQTPWHRYFGDVKVVVWERDEYTAEWWVICR